MAMAWDRCVDDVKIPEVRRETKSAGVTVVATTLLTFLFSHHILV